MFGRMLGHPAYWIIFFGVFIAASVTAGAAFFTATLYQTDIAKTESNLHKLALALTQQTEGAFQAVELAQQSITERMVSLGVKTSEDLRAVALFYPIHEFLKEQEQPLPHVEALSISDDQGNLLSTSRTWPIWPLLGKNISDRSYFKALKSDPNLQLFINEPVLSRISGKWTVLVARRLSSADGQFIGVIIGAIKLDYFESLYKEIASSPGRAVGLLRQDGVLLARYPLAEGAPRNLVLSPDNPSTAILARKGQGLVRNISTYDGKDRIVAVKSLQQYPIGLLLSDTADAALASWRYQATLIAFIALLMNLAVAAACLLGFRQVKATAKRAAAESYLARHDTLTHLPNRIHFNEEMERAIRSAQNSDKTFAVLLLDLDQFKEVNDTLGHAGGDELLRNVAARLRACVPAGDVLARIGGDEFAIIQRNLQSPKDTATLAGRLVEAICKPYELRGGLVSIGVSMGAALAPDDGTDPGRLLKSADLALYIAKKEGRGAFRFYSPEMEAGLVARRALEQDLRHALEAGQFELFYQPFLDLRTNLITGFEALLRWRHPKHGHVLPLEFISVAEETGLIGPLGDWVLQEACRQAATWPAPIKVAVNVSPIQFRMQDMMASVRAALASAGLPPSRLELEITESTLFEVGSVAEILHQIRALGVGIALDDFGTGYASMSHLRSFPFNKIKIDQSFVRDMDGSSDSTAIVYATLDLANRLGMTTTNSTL
jgi:diguanylate cyclase (GGDEF)-like protein